MKPSDSSNDEAVFVDENRNISRGEKAIELILARKAEEIDPAKGIIKVGEDRWREAQRYERRTWMEGVAAMSDRNEEHESCFGGYHSAPRFAHPRVSQSD